jgi:hypothetical protein
MYERRSSIHSDGDTSDEPLIGINTTDIKESDTEPLLDEIGVDPPTAGSFICPNTPTRYIIAIWAFFGFFCLYAMRVNLSVAIVAMVSIWIR